MVTLHVEDLRNGKRVPLHLETSYVAPWETNPYNVVTFEAYHPDLKGADTLDVKMNGFQLIASGGWIIGHRRTMQLPQSLFINWDDLLRRVWPDQKTFWRHGDGPVTHPLIAVIPDGLPGAGFVVVRNLSQLTAKSLTGSHLDQEAARRHHDRAILRALGFLEVQDGATHEGHPAGH